MVGGMRKTNKMKRKKFEKKSFPDFQNLLNKWYPLYGMISWTYLLTSNDFSADMVHCADAEQTNSECTSYGGAIHGKNWSRYKITSERANSSRSHLFLELPAETVAGSMIGHVDCSGGKATARRATIETCRS